jgi:hypothetical protein
MSLCCAKKNLAQRTVRMDGVCQGVQGGARLHQCGGLVDEVGGMLAKDVATYYLAIGIGQELC